MDKNIPKEKKGFNKLPEDVQKKIDPKLAAEYRRGGKVKKNTRRMNRLEELGRVDAEKAYTKKGKRNLKDEKKRVVKEIKGYDNGRMVTVSGRGQGKVMPGRNKKTYIC